MMKIFGGLEMSKFQETKTYQNLINAYAGESQARNRYTFFASVAKKAGYEQIAAIFEETAYNEKEHAKLYYKHIQDNLDEVPNMITVTGTYPIELSDTAANLLSAAQGEEDEVVDYTEWSKVAKEEGYDEYTSRIAQLKAEAIRTKTWFEYMAFKKKFASINYGYAISLYKIQGTTIRGVYVDINDIFGVKPLTNKRKLQSVYVGASRPTHFLAIF